MKFLRHINPFKLFTLKAKKVWCLIANKIYYLPKGKTLHWALNRNWFDLIFVYLLIHFAAAIIFSLIYLNTGGIVAETNSKEVHEINEVFDFIHFSLTTQTTLGYGDLSPVGFARVVAASQSAFGIVFNALALGVIITRIIKRSPRIIISDLIAYHNSDPHQLYFRIWNRDSDSFTAVEINLFVTRRVDLSVPPYRIFQAFPISTDVNLPHILAPNNIITFTTKSDDIDPKNPPRELQKEGPNPIAITSLQLTDEINLLVTAISVDKGDVVTYTKKFSLDKILCGTFLPLRPFENDTNLGPIKYKNFNRIKKRTSQECSICEIVPKCPLYIAEEYRRKSERGKIGMDNL